jgi:D-3-phosphoglycerate dehydrogenase
MSTSHAASKKGIIVMNTPFGNSITTAEHAIAMMFAVARQIPEANASTHGGKWEKSRFMGVELTGKTLGVIGAGNIGSIVISRALGLKMKVLAYDPFLSEERAKEIGATKVELDELLEKADFITLHVPFTEKTANILSAENLAKTKKGVRIVNCARGGLVDEAALAELLKSGTCRGRGLRRVPAGAGDGKPAVQPAQRRGDPASRGLHHRGAGKRGAAGGRADVGLPADGGRVQRAQHAVRHRRRGRRHGPLAEAGRASGRFVGQLTDEAIEEIEIVYNGLVKDMNLKALNCAAIAGVLKATNPEVNMVSAPVIARERGIELSTTTQDKTGVFDGYIRLVVKTEAKTRSIAGTVFSDGKPRFIQIKGINIDAEIGAHMLYTTNEDVPGIIGTLGQTMGENGVNIANFTLGRQGEGMEAIALLYLDAQPPGACAGQAEGHGMFQQVRTLAVRHGLTGYVASHWTQARCGIGLNARTSGGRAHGRHRNSVRCTDGHRNLWRGACSGAPHHAGRNRRQGRA